MDKTETKLVIELKKDVEYIKAQLEDIKKTFIELMDNTQKIRSDITVIFFKQKEVEKNVEELSNGLNEVKHTYIAKSELKDIEEIIRTVQDWKAISKLLLGIVSVLGFTNILFIIKSLFFPS